MATNVNLETRNCCKDFLGSYVYTVDHTNGILIKKNFSDGANIISYPLDTYINEVYTLYYDGIFFWTLEPVYEGVIIRRWYISSSILKLDKTFNYVSSSYLRINSRTFSVVHNTTFLFSSAAAGNNFVIVDSVSGFSIGEQIYIGVSSATNRYESFVITDIDVDNKKIYLDHSLTMPFSTDSSVVRLDRIWVFNDYALATESNAGALIVSPEDGTILVFHTGAFFRNVNAAYYEDGYINFVNGNALIYLDEVSKEIELMMYIDNLDVDRAGMVDIYAIFLKSDLFYRLQKKRVYYDSEWKTENWGSKYNFVTDTTVAQTYFVEVFSNPDVFHKKTEVYTDPTSDVLVKVFTQYRVPISGKNVSLSSTTGSVLPSSGSTNASGEFRSTYSGSSTAGLVTLTANVS